MKSRIHHDKSYHVTIVDCIFACAWFRYFRQVNRNTILNGAKNVNIFIVLHKRGETCLLVRFYRATLCVARSLLSSGVRLSRWCIVLSRRLKNRQTSFSTRYPIILVFFWLRAPIPNSKGNPVSEGAKYTGWENFAISGWNHRLSRKRYEIGPWLTWNVNRKP